LDFAIFEPFRTFNIVQRHVALADAFEDVILNSVLDALLTTRNDVCILQRSYGWKSRYVPEYSAIGEAPEEICESLDLHYRNSRGYFQTFWSYNCPLFNRDLGVFYRLMYSSRGFQSFASGAL
jgi:hypothetical protein